MSNVFLFLDLFLQILHGKKIWRTSGRWLFWAHMWMKVSLSCTYALLIACLGIEFQDGNNFPSTLKKIYLFLKNIIFGHSMQLVGTSFLNQGLNLGPRQWKGQVLTTGIPKNPPPPFAFKNISLFSGLHTDSKNIKPAKWYDDHSGTYS